MDTPMQPKQAFDQQELESLDLALAGALATAKEFGVLQRCLGGPIRRQLFVIASEGVTDSELLRDEVVKRMNIDRIAR